MRGEIDLFRTNNFYIKYSLNRALRSRVRDLEEELRLALAAGEDIKALKMKALQLMERQRSEKELRLGTERRLRIASSQVHMLSDHMEKLMIHLKHEAAAKSKAQELHRRAEREGDLLRTRIAALQRKVNAKDRALMEVREGSRILEDQLRLMDEKYLELRTKLDYTRSSTSKKVMRARREASELRTKFALMSGNLLLDNVDLPQSASTLTERALEEMESGGEDYLNLAEFDFSNGGGGGNNPMMTSNSMPSFPPSSDSRRGSKPSSKKRKKKKKMPPIEQVIDKINTVTGGGTTEWTDGKIQNLIQRR